MVVLHLKRGDRANGGGGGDDGFLYETSCATPVDALIADLVWVCNERLRLRALASGVRSLLQAPAPPAADDDDAERGSSSRGCGVVGAEAAGMLEKVVADVESYLCEEQVGRRIALRREVLEEKLANIRDAVATAFPELPDDHPIMRLLRLQQGQEMAEGLLEGTGIAPGAWLDARTAELWVAGKAFDRSQTVGDRVGRNEKTKVVAKLQSGGQGPPPREPVVSEAERTAMLAYYHKRQEELKRLAEADDDAYLASSWADNRGLQRSLRGVTDVRAPGFVGGGRRG